MPTPDEPSWSEIAIWYDQLLEEGSGTHVTATASLLRLATYVAGSSIVDIACGQGLATRALAAAGAKSVTGIDSSPAMIELAEARTDPAAAISYRVDDAQALKGCGDDEFDGTHLLARSYGRPQPRRHSHRGAARAQASRLVRVRDRPPVLPHPGATTCTDNEGRPGRFVRDCRNEGFWRSPNPNGVRRVGNYHRTLSTYLNALHRAGFRVEEAEEPLAEPLLARQQPVYVGIPVFLSVRARVTS